MRISDWSSDVCSSDLVVVVAHGAVVEAACVLQVLLDLDQVALQLGEVLAGLEVGIGLLQRDQPSQRVFQLAFDVAEPAGGAFGGGSCAQRGDRFEQRGLVAGIALDRRDQRRSEEHTSELQSLMRNSYAVFCLKT